jgi:hypothetical protein
MIDSEQRCGAVASSPSRGGGRVGATQVFAGGVREGARELQFGPTGSCFPFSRHEHTVCSRVEF